MGSQGRTTLPPLPQIPGYAADTSTVAEAAAVGTSTVVQQHRTDLTAAAAHRPRNHGGMRGGHVPPHFFRVMGHTMFFAPRAEIFVLLIS